MSEAGIPDGYHSRPPRTDAAATGLVGRQTEIGELLLALDKARAGSGQIVLIAGEPGIGKTALADSLATEAAARGILVLWGRCWEEGGAPAFWPWIQVLRACARERELIPALAGPGALDVRRLVPELGSSPEESASGAEPALSLASNPGDGEDLQHARFRQFDAITGLLQRAALQRPLLIIFEDCHAADEASLLLLRFFVRNLSQHPILVVATHREAEVSASPRLTELIGGLGREGRKIGISGLGEAHVKEFIELVGGIRPAPAIVAAFHGATEGNPFFLGEILRLWRAEGRAGDSRAAMLGTFGIPKNVRAAIHRRLEVVSPRTATALTLAAVVGRQFDIAVVEGMTDLSSEDLLDAMEEAVRASLIAEDGETIGRYRFCHALIGQVLRDELPRSQSHKLHRQIATKLEELYQSDLEAHLPELADHYVQSLHVGPLEPIQIDRAIDYASRAAGRARELLAFEEAARFYQLALKASDLQSNYERRRRCELLLRLADAWYRAGVFEQSHRTFQRALELAKNLGATDEIARAVLGITALPSDPGIVNETNVALLEQALGALGDRDSALRAMLLARLAWEHHWSDDDRREALSFSAVEIARRLGDKATLCYVLINRHLAAWSPDNLEERTAIASEAVRLCEDPAARMWELQARYLRMVDQLEAGDVQAVDRDIEYYSRLAEKSWLPLGYKERAQALRALMEGRFEQSERFAMQAFSMGQQMGQRSQLLFAAYQIALRREQGRLAEFAAAVSARPIDSNSVAHGIGRCWMVYCMAEAGHVAEAREQFETLAADDFASLRRDSTWLNATIFLAETCCVLEDASRAATLYNLLRPYASRNAVLTLNAAYGSVAHYLGVLASTMGNFDEAQTHFEDALRFNRRMGALTFVTRTQCEYAAMLVRRGREGDRGRVVDLLGGAFENAESIGMAGVVRKVRALLDKIQDSGAPAELIERTSDPGQKVASGVRRVLATILFTDIVASTERAAELGDRRFGQLLDQYYLLARRQFEAFKGREISTAGDGILAIFERPAHAIRCAWGIREAVRDLGIQIRAGLHAGECELAGDEVRGIAVHIGARVAAAAGPSEVLVSSTVKDLVAGSGIRFADRGMERLKGVPDQWHLFRAEPQV